MGLSKSSPANTQVKLLVSSTGPRIPWSLLSWLALGSGAALFVTVILSGAKLIVDPYSPNWLKSAFPGLVTSFEADPQTAAEVEAELRSQNLTTAQPVAWPNINQPKAWIYPILSADGRSVQELWVYRARGDQRQRVEQVSIRPMKESFITTPLVGTASQVASVDSDAALTTVKLMPGKSSDSPWLLLEGQRRYGNTVMRYGQILSYQPRSQRLHRLLNWSSSAGQPPQWQSGGNQLVIDQTVGLRPSFLLYQLIPNEPPQLKEVSLYRSVYSSELSTSLYDKALKLAQGAVWYHSVQMMQSAKQALAEDWSSAAQAQLDLIRLHANRTKSQTEQTWSSQQQHILAYLIDGQWEKALRLLEENPAIYEATLKRLERDFEPLWRAVTVHLQVHPKDTTTQIWGALLVASRQSPEAGEAWLKQKTTAKTALNRLRAVGRQPEIVVIDKVVDNEESDTSTAAAPLPVTSSPGRYLGMVGQARAIGAPTGEWLRLQTVPTPVAGQTWYQIDVNLLQDSSGWGLPPVAANAASFWAESLAMRQQIQLFSDGQAVAAMAIHGIEATASGLTLLAIGPTVEGAAVVATNHSLRWVNTLPWQIAPAPPALNESETPLDASTPMDTQDVETRIATTIGAQLDLTLEQTAQLYSYLQYTRLDLSGDSAEEHVFLVGSEVPPDLALTPGKIMIFSSSGELIYSDVGQQQSLIAMTDKSPERPVTLLVEQAGHYELIGL